MDNSHLLITALIFSLPIPPAAHNSCQPFAHHLGQGNATNATGVSCLIPKDAGDWHELTGSCVHSKVQQSAVGMDNDIRTENKKYGQWVHKPLCCTRAPTIGSSP
eukprot:TRINITY_DN67180_c10_g7_i1.p1 TRINITY_DN67180_c10_g7~~TRINITY_DN67180_c10_g7_i1.p1  ORF type:complete len:105 (-),score=3.06 TRINITY_DN67180_c10_g7_i1:187-501(-)